MKLRAAVCCAQLLAVVVTGGGLTGTSTASADNKRLNDGVVANVYTVQHNAGCTNDVKINPRLQLAAQWRASRFPDCGPNRVRSGKDERN